MNQGWLSSGQFGAATRRGWRNDLEINCNMVYGNNGRNDSYAPANLIRGLEKPRRHD